MYGSLTMIAHTGTGYHSHAGGSFFLLLLAMLMIATAVVLASRSRWRVMHQMSGSGVAAACCSAHAATTTRSGNGSKPHRVRLQRKAGWRMPENTVKVDRSTQWGNHHYADTVEESVELYRKEVEKIRTKQPARFQSEYVEPLRGKNLACWCADGAPCHALVLLDLVNRK